MVKTMQKSLSVCWPFVLTALLSMLAFSTLCGFLYKDLGTAYFASTITSFFTAFQLSLGEGWDKVKLVLFCDDALSTLQYLWHSYNIAVHT